MVTPLHLPLNAANIKRWIALQTIHFEIQDTLPLWAKENDS